MLIKNCHDYPLILASTSKIRQEILTSCGLDFKSHPPLFDEEKSKENTKLNPPKLAIFLAKQKALSLSDKYPNSYIIGSDQTCEFEKKAISKSNNAEQAIAQLKKFSGKEHIQNNGVAIAFGGKIIFSKLTKSKLQMRKISLKEIENYVKIDQPWGCAGSYKYESLGKHLFAKVSGDYYTILGLAIQPLITFLHDNKIIKIQS